MIATVGTKGIGDSREKHGLFRWNLADATLIAAAPDLLVACKDAIVLLLALGDEDLMVYSRNQARSILKAAIAKAEGVRIHGLPR